MPKNWGVTLLTWTWLTYRFIHFTPVNFWGDWYNAASILGMVFSSYFTVKKDTSTKHCFNTSAFRSVITSRWNCLGKCAEMFGCRGVNYKRMVAGTGECILLFDTPSTSCLTSSPVSDLYLQKGLGKMSVKWERRNTKDYTTFQFFTHWYYAI